MKKQLNKTVSEAMTVKELIEALQDYPENMPVVFSYDYGDRWHTEVAMPISEIDESLVEYSSYHNKLKIHKITDEELAEEISMKVLVIK